MPSGYVYPEPCYTRPKFTLVDRFLSLFSETYKFILIIFFYVIPCFRPNIHWSYYQAVAVRLIRLYLAGFCSIDYHPALSLQPKSEKDRFVTISPLDDKYLVGPLKSTIKPSTVGGTWFPTPFVGQSSKSSLLDSQNGSNVDVLLHFHGGAYIMGDGREDDSGYLVRTILTETGIKYCFSSQYRLACHKNGQFPAPLQDGLACYLYLLNDLHIPASRITFSGDSAGGNLVLALLRFIQEYGKQFDLPQPACAFLWSPWIDLVMAANPANVALTPNRGSDYVVSMFGSLGAWDFCTSNRAVKHWEIDPINPYISPIYVPFKTRTPLFVQTGSAEVLFQDLIAFSERYSDGKRIDLSAYVTDDIRRGDLYTENVPPPACNVLELHISENAPHDISLIGNMLGFDTEYRIAARAAYAFLEKSRNTLG